MLRLSLRSVSDPVRGHVCLSCLVPRVKIPARSRSLRFYSAASSAPEAGENRVTIIPPQPRDPSLNLPGERKENIPKPSGQDEPPSVHSKQDPGDPGTQAASPASGIDKAASSQEDGAATSPDSGEDKLTIKEKKKVARRQAKALKRAEQRKAKREAAKRKKEIKAVTKKLRSSPTASAATSEAATAKGPLTSQDKSRILDIVRKAQTKAKSKKDPAVPDPNSSEKLIHLKNNVSRKSAGTLHAENLTITPLDIETAPVPNLSFGLERVLFNPGVYHLRDPRSRVYNFDPYLGSIMPVTEFDFDALKQYITSSKDETLREIAVKERKKYVGSSSSMTSVLSHFHYLLSAWRAININNLSQGFPDRMRTFTRLLRAPAAMFLHYQDGIYAIDADKEFDSANILMNLGKSMEKLLTLPKEEFERYRKSSQNKISAEEEQATPESYHYSTQGDFIMRSQLDAHDPRLPGTGMFDLKTRAVVSIRMDTKNFEHGLGYQIRSRFGGYESYEREFFDMIRAAFLKYSLQVRVGRMDGIFVAFHNIERIFGFQYISLPEMDETLHGQSDTSLGDAEFRLSLSLWNKILDKATTKFPKRSLRFHFETRDAHIPFMYIFAEPVTEEEIHAIQTKNQAEIEEFQRRVLNLGPKEEVGDSTVSAEPSGAEPEEVQNSAESPDSTDVKADDLASKPESAAEVDSSPASDEQSLQELADDQEQPRDLLALALTVTNKVNGRQVERPVDFTSNDKWSVDYELCEIENPHAWHLYKACQKRRQKALEGRGEDETDVAGNGYIRKLREISQQGRLYRAQEEQLDREKGIVVLSDPIPQKKSD